jgi:hypothetical protein
MIAHDTSSNQAGSPYNGVTGSGVINVTVYDNDDAQTDTPTPTNTSSATPTVTDTAITTQTPSDTPTDTPTQTETATATPTASETTTPTDTAMPTDTATSGVPTIIIVMVSTVHVTEGGTGYTYNVRLNRAPAAGEKVTILPVYDSSQMSIFPASRQLDSGNWNTGRNFTIFAVNDDTVEPSPMAFGLTHMSLSNQAGSAWNGASSTMVNVNIYDNDGESPIEAPPNEIPSLTSP